MMQMGEKLLIERIKRVSLKKRCESKFVKIHGGNWELGSLTQKTASLQLEQRLGNGIWACIVCKKSKKTLR
ncbi:MAG: hypothetical protein DRR19_20320 [Candidatus Parabeggiatoa sp. nov. 1]|nr:MAG: hypothetical protein DRR19_20320 [Gammaproteobacteria bacterium]